MQCFQDCCLFCDRDSPDGAYCSQQCKLADHERSNASNPSTPSNTSSGQWTSYHADSKRQSQHFGSVSSTSSASSYYPYQSAAERHYLSASSSQSSLSSTMSSSPGGTSGMSAQARQDLQGFFSSFDQARAAKRRSTTR
jgi:hypothetical protein